jgi:hypothetical protein
MNAKWSLCIAIAAAVGVPAFFFFRGDGDLPLGLKVTYGERPALLSQGNYGNTPDTVQEVSIQNMSARAISLTDFIVNDRPECLKRLRTEPIVLTKGDITYLKPSCDVVQIEIWSDKGINVFPLKKAP